MDIAQIEARPREARGTRACRRLRRQELVPAVLYGRGQPGVLLTLREGDVEHLAADRTFIVQVNWNGQQENAQIRELQYDALQDHITHVDLVRISLTETITVAVPLEPRGEAPGVAEGGVLELVMHELEVECLPTAVPEEIRIEVGKLEIGDNLTVADLTLPEGVSAVAEPDTVVITVVPPAELEEEEEGEEALLEPEVIGEAAEEGPQEEEPEEE